MEDSRKGNRSGKKGLPTPDPHVDGENGKKAIVYNTKKGGKKRTKKKKGRRKKKEKEKEKKERIEYS